MHKIEQIEIPQKLKEIENPPLELYAVGDLSLLSRKKVAIVGSRNALFYSKDMTYKLAQKLSLAGIVVVSGGAMGIDASAHAGAFPNTIALLASSLDIFYPKINEKLLTNISKDGLLLSEYKVSTRATNYSFVLRNRLVVGLCNALVISQAEINSGSMRSAEFALKFGVPIFVLPHRLGESSGTEMLVKEGKAKTIEDMDNFVKLFSDTNTLMIKDEILEFCIKNSDLNACLAKFGDKIYEYELEGKIKISQMRVSIV
ncbi:MAG: DNA-processing protein DprA [Campylobacteraceae bacterium]